MAIGVRQETEDMLISVNTKGGNALELRTPWLGFAGKMIYDFGYHTEEVISI